VPINRRFCAYFGEQILGVIGPKSKIEERFVEGTWRNDGQNGSISSRIKKEEEAI